MTHEDFLRRFEQEKRNYSKLENVEILGTYKNTRTEILVRCLVDGHMWEVTPNSLLSGRGCPKCNNNLKTMFYSTFLHNFNYLYPDLAQNYEIIEDTYSNTTSLVTVKHKCGNMYEIKHASYLHNGGGLCPYCDHELSQGATHTKEYLQARGYKFEMEKTFEDLKDKNLLRYDFFLTFSSGKQIALEYHGIQHYDDCNTLHEDYDAWQLQHYHDLEKKDYAFKSGFYYLEVPCYVPFHKIPEFLDFYLAKAESTEINNLVPDVVLDLLNRELSTELDKIFYGDWCLVDGDLKLPTRDLSDSSELLIADKMGMITKSTVGAFVRGGVTS